jgi:hypothetical protein
MSFAVAKRIYWTVSGLLYALLAAASVTATAGTLDAVEAAGKVADLAGQKDIVWLSLVTAMAAIAGLCWQSWAYQRAINRLADQLAARPCAFLRKNAAGEWVFGQPEDRAG